MANQNIQLKVFGIGIAILVQFAVVVRLFTQLEGRVNAVADRQQEHLQKGIGDRVTRLEEFWRRHEEISRDCFDFKKSYK